MGWEQDVRGVLRPVLGLTEGTAASFEELFRGFEGVIFNECSGDFIPNISDLRCNILRGG